MKMPKADQHVLYIRVPAELKDRLKKAAEERSKIVGVHVSISGIARCMIDEGLELRSK
jgi:predicted DNA-binding protein